MEKSAAREVARKIWPKYVEEPGFRDRVFEAIDSEFARFRNGRILAYIAMPDEFDFLSALLKTGLPVYIPRITVVPCMEFRLFQEHNLSLLERGPYGILQPRLQAPLIEMPPGRNDVAIVPSLSVNPGGYRLGRGGGFYDRWRENLKETRVISILPAELLGLDFPAENHDLRLNAVITERGIVDYKK